MKKQFLIIILIYCLFFAVSGLFLVGCYRESFQSVPKNPALASGLTGTSDHQAPPWIDDFDHDNKPDAYSYYNLIRNPDYCLTASYAGGGVTTGYAVHNAGAMEVGVSDNTAGRWFGFYSALDSTAYPNTLGLDVTGYSDISFSIKGTMSGGPTGGGLRFFIRAIGTSPGNEIKKTITTYLPSGVTASWQTVTAPIADFSGAPGWSSRIAVFTIAFEDAAGDPTNGTIFIDDLRFIPSN
ncbi:MAG: hypothetical protein KKH98_05695 [Spirochaetes bacterium]|nr:hypothetical protein [Spirochaetota bacterium]